jgi:hypothetical protein
VFLREPRPSRGLAKASCSNLGNERETLPQRGDHVCEAVRRSAAQVRHGLALGQLDASRVTAALRCARCPRSPGRDSWTTCGRSPRTGRCSSYFNGGLDWRFAGSAHDWARLHMPRSIRAMTSTPTAARQFLGRIIRWSGHDISITHACHPADGLFSSDAVSGSDPRSPRAELSGVALSP